jgi:hypothetical protein
MKLSLRTRLGGALHKCWKGYIIALNRFEPEEMREYASRIQKLQRELGIEVSAFPWLTTLR